MYINIQPLGYDEMYMQNETQTFMIMIQTILYLP